ncbi:putative Flagellar FlaF family protein [Candidatus Terasakiella magnetica]|nr:putative Flagellar FlaF family protein [Candidatus Terasakiella magnetica]
MAYPTTPQGGYTSVPAPGNPRQTEAWALTETARRISLSQSENSSIDDFLAAIRVNWRLWTIFQAELASDECALPIEMRQNVLSLCNFVDKRTVEIIASRDRSLADSLININRQLAAGLFVQVPSPAAPGEDATAPAKPQPTNEVI